ncbi:hypothetical protein SNE40_013718 [Patella caerulea]|uniref:Uncharacterized protein n=1 Tax=Patella caerulea TaxID=87958 RepID=A0AAN8JFL3_PATCE
MKVGIYLLFIGFLILGLSSADVDKESPLIDSKQAKTFHRVKRGGWLRSSSANEQPREMVEQAREIAEQTRELTERRHENFYRRTTHAN